MKSIQTHIILASQMVGLKNRYDLGAKATTHNKTKGMPDYTIYKVELDL